MLFVPRAGVRVLLRPVFIRTPAAARASAALAVSASHRTLEPCARLIRNAGVRGLGLGQRRCSRGVVRGVRSIRLFLRAPRPGLAGMFGESSALARVPFHMFWG